MTALSRADLHQLATRDRPVVDARAAGWRRLLQQVAGLSRDWQPAAEFRAAFLRRNPSLVGREADVDAALAGLQGAGLVQARRRDDGLIELRANPEPPTGPPDNQPGSEAFNRQLHALSERERREMDRAFPARPNPERLQLEAAIEAVLDRRLGALRAELVAEIETRIGRVQNNETGEVK